MLNGAVGWYGFAILLAFGGLTGCGADSESPNESPTSSAVVTPSATTPARPPAPVTTEVGPRGYTCADGICRWPDGSVVPNYQRCGTQCGEPPTSGEIQTEYGCEQGYITGVLCDPYR